VKNAPSPQGIDEVDNLQGEVSWVSRLHVLAQGAGGEVSLMTPAGWEKLEVVEVRYPASRPRRPKA